MKSLLATALLATLLIGCNDETTQTPSSDVIQLEQYEIAGLKVDLPAPPVPETMEFPENIRQYVVSSDNFKVDWGSMTIMISNTSFSIDQASLDGAADGAIAQVKANPVATDFTSSKQPVEVAGLEGREIRMDLKQDNHPITQRSIIFVRGGELWQIQIIAPGDDNLETIEDLKKSVFGSIKLQ